MFCGGCWSLVAGASGAVIAVIAALQRRHITLQRRHITLQRRHLIIVVIHRNEGRLQRKLNHTLKTLAQTLIAEICHAQHNTGEGGEVHLHRDERIRVIGHDVEERDEVVAELVIRHTDLVLALGLGILVAKLNNALNASRTNQNLVIALTVLVVTAQHNRNALVSLREGRHLVYDSIYLPLEPVEPSIFGGPNQITSTFAAITGVLK